MQTRSAFLYDLGGAIGVSLAARDLVAVRRNAPAVRHLRLGHWASVNSPHHAFAERFAGAVSEATGGALTVDVFPSEQLGSNIEQLAAQRAGTLDFSLPTSTALGRVDARFTLLTLPYLFDSTAHAYALLDGPIGQDLFRRLPANGIRVLACSSNGMRNITNSRQPINTLGDLANLNIRVPPNALSVAMFRSFGAEPVTLPYSQVATALRDRRVDGQENPLINVYADGFYRYQQYLALTRHQFEVIALAVSEKTWNSFDEVTRRRIAQAGAENGLLHRSAFERADAAARSKLRAAGIQISEPDRGEFKQNCRHLYRQCATVFGATLVENIERAAQRS